MSNPSQELLIAEGVVGQRSLAQKMVIGCLACRWGASEAQGDEPTAYARQIAQCSGFAPATITNVLKRFERGGVVTGTRKVFSRRGAPVRVDYGPVDSELGSAFRDGMEVPQVCGLEDSTIPASQRQAWRATVDDRKEAKSTARATRAEAARAARQEALVHDIISQSSVEELETIIAKATQRIEQLNGPQT